MELNHELKIEYLAENVKMHHSFCKYADLNDYDEDIAYSAWQSTTAAGYVLLCLQTKRQLNRKSKVVPRCK